MTSDNGYHPDIAAAAIASIAHPLGQRMTEITLENGIRLRLKPVPPHSLRQVYQQMPPPQVPVHVSEEKGRPEPNPNDPEYLEGLIRWQEAQSQAALTIGLITGTELIEPLPDGFVGPDSDDWITKLEETYAVLITVNPTLQQPTIHREPASARYLDWLRLYAIPTEVDLFRLTQLLTSGIALTEEEVQASAESFRRRSLRFANLDAPVTSLDPLRDPDPPAVSGDGAGVRGADGGEVGGLPLDGLGSPSPD